MPAPLKVATGVCPSPEAVPRSRTRGQQFDELVLDAVEELETRWAAELEGVEFAVEDVPQVAPGGVEFDPEVIADHGLGRLIREGLAAEPGHPPAPTIVVYRRPVESRARATDERADLVLTIVAELVAELLGRDLDEIDPA